MLPHLSQAPNTSGTAIPGEIPRQVFNPVVTPTLLVHPSPESNSLWGHSAAPQTPLQGRTPGADVTPFAGILPTLITRLNELPPLSGQSSQDGGERQAKPVVPGQLAHPIGASADWMTLWTTSKRRRPALRLR